MSIYVPLAAKPAPKAAFGQGTNYYLSGEPTVSDWRNDPSSRMRRAWGIGRAVPWIRAAERAITNLGSTVGWHLEDVDDTEVDDEYPNTDAQSARALIEKPQALLGAGQKLSRRELWALTLRHMGLCGNAFWMLDQPNQIGLPGAVIYLRPDRMTPIPDNRGNLVGWVIDADARGNGVPATLDEIVQFVLEPPDEGFFGIGLVESALLKAELSQSMDRHLGIVLNAGSRKTGILAPKQGYWDEPIYQQMVNDWRVASEGGDAARRAQIVRAPVDFTETQLSPADMSIRELMTGLRDDLLALWGVPGSSLGLHDRGKGLGATAATSTDNESLWKNAVGPRLTAFAEPVQFEILDRWQTVGVTVELELETPEFDDDTPQFTKAQLAQSIALTRNERRELIGHEPLPDYGPDGDPLGLAIDLPIAITVVGQGPEPDGKFANAPAPEPPPPALPPGGGAPALLPGGVPQLTAGKAALHQSVAALRRTAEQRYTPRLRTAMRGFFHDQRRDIAARLREHAEHVAKRPSDTAVWFTKTWDRRLHDLLKPYLAGMAQPVAQHIADVLPAKKAGPVEAVDRALNRGAARVTKINATTRDKIRDAVARGIDQGYSVLDVADLIEGIDTEADIGLDLDSLFDEYRSELIARTELMDAYNGAALGSYSDAGVSSVQAIDGDQDEECAERDGQVFSIEDADAIEDHPNGTLDWAPVLEAA